MKAIYALALCLAMQAFAPLRSSAQDILIDVPAHTITSVISDVVRDYLRSGASDFALLENVTLASVSASAAGDTSVHVTLNLLFAPGGLPLGLPVAVEADLVVLCGSDGPWIELTSAHVNTLGVSVSEQELAEVTAQANTMLVMETKALVKPIWDRLETIKEPANVHQVCPTVSIAADGSLHAELDFYDGCINGDRQVEECGRDENGQGIIRDCVNGRWIVERDCGPLHK